MPISDQQILSEIELLIRRFPPKETALHQTDENLDWLGQVEAVIRLWDKAHSIFLLEPMASMRSAQPRTANEALSKIKQLLFRARHDLRLRTNIPLTRVIDAGDVFDYFEGIRDALVAASKDVMFVDPYLDVQVVGTYLPQVPSGVTIRLLLVPHSARVARLLPAVDLFCQQHGASVSVRTMPTLHDRHVVVDRQQIYFSGASIKDGAKKSPTMIGDIVDGASTMLSLYEEFWNSATIER